MKNNIWNIKEIKVTATERTENHSNESEFLSDSLIKLKKKFLRRRINLRITDF